MGHSECSGAGGVGLDNKELPFVNKGCWISKSLLGLFQQNLSFHFLRLSVCLFVLQSFMQADQCSDLVDGLWSQSEP